MQRSPLFWASLICIGILVQATAIGQESMFPPKHRQFMVSDLAPGQNVAWPTELLGAGMLQSQVETAESMGDMIRLDAPTGEVLLLFQGDDPTNDFGYGDFGYGVRAAQSLSVGGEEDDNSEEDDDASQRSESTRKQIQRLKKPISDVRIQATEAGERVPDNSAEGFSENAPWIMIAAIGSTPPMTNRYTAGLKHRPLYFEERNLERCGRGFYCLQNAVSGIHFLASTIVLPYRMCAQPCCCCVPAGGDCMTCQKYPLDCNLCPISPGGLTTQAAAMAGFTFLLL